MKQLKFKAVITDEFFEGRKVVNKKIVADVVGIDFGENITILYDGMKLCYAWNKIEELLQYTGSKDKENKEIYETVEKGI